MCGLVPVARRPSRVAGNGAGLLQHFPYEVPCHRGVGFLGWLCFCFFRYADVKINSEIDILILEMTPYIYQSYSTDYAHMTVM